MNKTSHVLLEINYMPFAVFTTGRGESQQWTSINDLHDIKCAIINNTLLGKTEALFLLWWHDRFYGKQDAKV